MSFSIEYMCRTCMCDGLVKKEFALTKVKEKQMVSLSTIPEDVQGDISLMDILRATVPQLKVDQNDKLPDSICLECTNKLKEIHQFQQNCLRVENKFSELLEAIKADDNHSLSDIFDIVGRDDGVRLLKPDLDNVACMDDNSFHSDQFIDEDNASEDLLDINDDDFIQSCSDLSIDFVLDEDSENDFEESKKSKESRRKSISAKKPNTPKQKESVTDVVYTCNICKKELKSQRSLKSHLEVHVKRTGKERERKCNICDKAFGRAYLLRDHLRSHNGEKPFLCSECGKGFTTSSSLKQHIFRHKGERQFTCPDCPKAFTTRTDLFTHSIVHKAKARTHVCDICGSGFTRAFVLKQHKMYHTNERAFSCEHCDKRFYTNEKLQRHTRIHTGDKPYKCKYCEKAYSQSNDLTKHLRSHIGDNVYQCELCPQRFPTVKLMKEHFILHKNDDELTKAENLAALNALEIKGIFCK